MVGYKHYVIKKGDRIEHQIGQWPETLWKIALLIFLRHLLKNFLRLEALAPQNLRLLLLETSN